MKRLHLSLHILFAAALVLFATGAQAASALQKPAWSDGGCQVNCVSVYRTGSRLFFFANNAMGHVIATGRVSLPETAQAIDGGGERRSAAKVGGSRDATTAGLPVSGTCLGTVGTCVDHSVLRFETSTHIIIVTVTYFFINGELHDIDVREKRFAKNKIK